MLHITNGDATLPELRRTGLTGDLLPWRDVLHEGPVPLLDPGELRASGCASSRAARPTSATPRRS